ncbi:hypothetical protein AMR72_17225 [Flavobacterium psychrophilum]|nr:hypothetical protein AMR72_17225 [Flavobacterium psychrophilum]AOE54093.1 hypothetical protein ALW18_17215 [Flavobacterium psychrophilum]
MDTIVRLRVKKELDNRQHKSILGLKGSIISKGYTDIIHISDEGEEFHINSFLVLQQERETILEYVALYLKENKLEKSATLL